MNMETEIFLKCPRMWFQKELLGWLSSRAEKKIKTARKEIKAKKSETISMFSCVSRQKLKKDSSAQKPKKQFYSRDRSSERRNRLKMLFVQSPSVFYGHFFFFNPLALVNVINCFKIFIIERRKSEKQIEDEVETRGDQFLGQTPNAFGENCSCDSLALQFTLRCIGKMAQKRGENDTNAIWWAFLQLFLFLYFQHQGWLVLKFWKL